MKRILSALGAVATASALLVGGPAEVAQAAVVKATLLENKPAQAAIRNISAEQDLGQSFTLTKERAVDSVSIYSAYALNGNQSEIIGDITLQLWRGTPDSGVVIHTQNYPSVHFGGDPNAWHFYGQNVYHENQWVKFQFPEINLPAGQYSFTLQSGNLGTIHHPASSGPECDWSPGMCTSWDEPVRIRPASSESGTNTDFYAGGDLWYRGDQQTTWTKNLSGGTAQWRGDLAFRIGGVAPGSTPAVPAQWVNAPAVPLPTEVRLKVLGLSSDSGSSWKAATQALIRYHKVKSVSQCEVALSIIFDCAANDGSFSNINEALHQAGLNGMAYSPTQQLSLAEIKSEINAGRPIVARLTNYKVNNQPHSDMYAMINGYSATGVHFMLFPDGLNGPAVYSPQGGSMPYAEFVNRTSVYTYSTGGAQQTSTWKWEGTLKGAEGDPDSIPGSTENYSSEEVAKIVWNDAPAMFDLTLSAMAALKYGFPCLNPNQDVLEGNEEMLASLQDFWTMQGLSMVVQYMPLPSASIARSAPIETTLSAVSGVSMALFQGSLSFEHDDDLKTDLREAMEFNMGFEAALARGVLFLAYDAGACSY